MTKKLKPLTRAQLEVVDTVALLAVVGKVEKARKEMTGYTDSVIDGFTPKEKQIYSAIQRRSKKIMKQYIDEIDRQRNAG